MERSCNCATLKCCCGENRIMDVSEHIDSLISARMEDLENKGTWKSKHEEG
jgi:hypothetical protein